MSRIFSTFCCCQKLDPDVHLSTSTEENDAHSVQTVSVISQSESSSEAGAARGRVADPAEETQPPDLQYHAHPVYKKGAFDRFNLETLVGPVDQAGNLGMATEKEQLRGYRLMKQRLETLPKEKAEIESEVLQAKQTTESLEQGKPFHDHQCPGMNEVLEMIRDGVSLRHVIRVHKDFQSDEGPEMSHQAGPELHRILKKRKESSDKYISGGSGQKNHVDGAVQDQELKPHPGLRRSPRQDDLSGLYQVKFEECKDIECDLNDGSCNGDRSSTASTLPLTTPLNQGQGDWVLQSSGSETSVPVRIVDNLSTTGNELPQEEWSACPELDCTNVEGDYGNDHHPKPIHDNSLLNSTNQSPLQEYLDCGKQSTLPLNTTLPLESFRADSYAEPFEARNLGSEMEPSGLAADPVTQSFSCVIPPHPTQFVLLHDMMKPQQVVASGVVNDDDQVLGRRIFRI